MRILKTLLGSLAAASICAPAQARVIDTSATYTNPETVPVPLAAPSVVTTYDADYHGLPESMDFKGYYKEYTSPGPVVTFTLNTPTTLSSGTSVPNTIKFQTWFLDPTPENPVENDKNAKVDNDDKRIPLQTLDLCELDAIPSLMLNAVGFEDAVKPSLPGCLLWNNMSLDGKPFALEGGYFTLDGDTSHLTGSSSAWSQPRFSETKAEEGTVGLIYDNSIKTYVLMFSLTDNTDIYAGYVATIGKMTEGLDLLKSVAGISDNKLATTRTVSKNFANMPLWNTYTDDEYDAYKQPEQSDFVRIMTASVSDPAEVAPSHGLKFVEDPPYDADSTDDKNDLTDPNADIKKLFNVSLSEDGLFSFKLRDDVPLSSSVLGTYIFTFRVYVNDGTNNGKAGTDYFRSQAAIYVQHPFAYYAGGATRGASVDYSPSKDGSNVWYWYSHSTYGWFLVKDFPDNRWVYSYEHGWIYMYGDKMNTEDGVVWYNAVSSWGTSNPATDDEVGYFWTNAQMFPNLYSYKDGGMVYYIKDVDSNSTDDKDDDDYKERILDKRLFWSYRQNAYITPSGADTTYEGKPFKIYGKKFGTGL